MRFLFEDHVFIGVEGVNKNLFEVFVKDPFCRTALWLGTQFMHLTDSNSQFKMIVQIPYISGLEGSSAETVPPAAHVMEERWS